MPVGFVSEYQFQELLDTVIWQSIAFIPVIKHIKKLVCSTNVRALNSTIKFTFFKVIQAIVCMKSMELVVVCRSHAQQIHVDYIY